MSYTYIIFNKPCGVLSQFTDQEGRQTLKDYIKTPGVYAAGRLDFDSEGLLLLTNDGEINHLLTDPEYKKPKIYLAQVEGDPTEERLNDLRKGPVINGKRTTPPKVELLKEEPRLWERTKPIRFRKTVPTHWLKITIYEGINHQVRKMTAKVGLPCLRLVRTSIGPLELGKLQPGEYKVIPKPRLEV
ncbi:MAG: pseudouridine synthase [Candidatus Saganbacteria bacterium]|nr:pseudouridine synthase [Candidatus Saganbacteria bacterium]